MRRKYRWDEEQQCLVEVDLNYRTPERLPVVGDSHYDGLRATDGTPIDTRAKHREYMRANGLTTADDFTETWKKASESRAEFLATGGDHKGRRESIERTIYQLEQRQRRG